MASTISAGTTSGTALSMAGDTSGILQLQTNGTTTAVTINTAQGVQALNCISVGNATPSTSGAGITFPATQSASTDANTLDDYEEGTWTPAIAPATGSLTAYTSSGRYTKIGNTVFVSGRFTITTAGTAASYAIVSGYPFTANSAQSFTGSCREAAATGNIYIAQIGASTTSGIIGGNANGAITWTNSYTYDWNFTYQI
jgi:hypothetical protein